MEEKERQSILSQGVRVSIVSLLNACIRGFGSILNHILYNHPDYADSSVNLDEELGRLRLWAGNYGAHRKGGRTRFSMASSKDDDVDTKILIPPPPIPEDEAGETPFICPYCCQAVTVKSIHDDWNIMSTVTFGRTSALLESVSKLISCTTAIPSGVGTKGNFIGASGHAVFALI
ncbi:hypothetical protein BDV06DRAFT_222021 [Aspergillus oleicola]